MQTTAIGTIAKSLPQNEVILLTILISSRHIPYTDLMKFSLKTLRFHVEVLGLNEKAEISSSFGVIVSFKSYFLAFPR